MPKYSLDFGFSLCVRSLNDSLAQNNRLLFSFKFCLLTYGKTYHFLNNNDRMSSKRRIRVYLWASNSNSIQFKFKWKIISKFADIKNLFLSRCTQVEAKYSVQRKIQTFTQAHAFEFEFYQSTKTYIPYMRFFITIDRDCTPQAQNSLTHLERLILGRINDTQVEEKLPTDQTGLRIGESTTDQVVNLTNNNEALSRRSISLALSLLSSLRLTASVLIRLWLIWFEFVLLHQFKMNNIKGVTHSKQLLQLFFVYHESHTKKIIILKKYFVSWKIKLYLKIYYLHIYIV